ncbi:hypothetical protein CLV91_2951 [Maribacter vaceletii]|uniref:Uncharacterized protein n=1 Tax=Maribacter vaceletii TaxID=1206816 RepID=A0A495DUC7_9FLAO|nr:hypothetical protein [Maribacter vaceletii]RKR07769.1 hypothetical protein CLV91_2951 [Maribacter vaceletii]
MKKFIEVSLGSYSISHGYDTNNKEITENFKVEGFFKKIVALERIKSVSEKYILTDYLDGRWIYWEYKETYNDVKLMLGL